VTLYTASGLVASAGVGAVLGLLGHTAGLAGARTAVLSGAIFLGSVLAARELRIIRFRLPERRLQTEKAWMHQFGVLGASTMWGIHLSLGFFTRINYGGFWLLSMLAIGLANPLVGALLVGGHWLGKALPVWLGPALFEDTNDICVLPGVLADAGGLYRRVQAVGLVAVSTVLAVWLAVPGAHP
jgi:hypothetical protein